VVIHYDEALGIKQAERDRVNAKPRVLARTYFQLKMFYKLVVETLIMGTL
jgi:hypothetical protein